MAARRFVESGLEPLVLNFANGVQPGGGFLYGARAQEEVLCRSSALFETIVDDPMYEHHWDRERPDSTDWAIRPPGVPVSRDDDDLSEFVDRQLFPFLTLFQLRHSLL
ncbi:TIGR02452 family protein [Rhodopirellula sp. SM50]|nr:TIGR02452 family protein [Rhodopirellula sp. SM50]